MRVCREQNMDCWEVQPSSFIENATNYYTKAEVDALLSQIWDSIEAIVEELNDNEIINDNTSDNEENNSSNNG